MGQNKETRHQNQTNDKQGSPREVFRQTHGDLTQLNQDIEAKVNTETRKAFQQWTQDMAAWMQKYKITGDADEALPSLGSKAKAEYYTLMSRHEELQKAANNRPEGVRFSGPLPTPTVNGGDFWNQGREETVAQATPPKKFRPIKTLEGEATPEANETSIPTQFTIKGKNPKTITAPAGWEFRIGSGRFSLDPDKEYGLGAIPADVIIKGQTITFTSNKEGASTIFYVHEDKKAKQIVINNERKFGKSPKAEPKTTETEDNKEKVQATKPLPKTFIFDKTQAKAYKIPQGYEVYFGREKDKSPKTQVIGDPEKLRLSGDPDDKLVMELKDGTLHLSQTTDEPMKMFIKKEAGDPGTIFINNEPYAEEHIPAAGSFEVSDQSPAETLKIQKGWKFMIHTSKGRQALSSGSYFLDIPSTTDPNVKVEVKIVIEDHLCYIIKTDDKKAAVKLFIKKDADHQQVVLNDEKKFGEAPKPKEEPQDAEAPAQDPLAARKAALDDRIEAFAIPYEKVNGKDSSYDITANGLSKLNKKDQAEWKAIEKESHDIKVLEKVLAQAKAEAKALKRAQALAEAEAKIQAKAQAKKNEQAPKAAAKALEGLTSRERTQAIRDGIGFVRLTEIEAANIEDPKARPPRYRHNLPGVPSVDASRNTMEHLKTLGVTLDKRGLFYQGIHLQTFFPNHQLEIKTIPSSDPQDPGYKIKIESIGINNDQQDQIWYIENSPPDHLSGGYLQFRNTRNQTTIRMYKDPSRPNKKEDNDYYIPLSSLRDEKGRSLVQGFLKDQQILASQRPLFAKGKLGRVAITQSRLHDTDRAITYPSQPETVVSPWDKNGTPNTKWLDQYIKAAEKSAILEQRETQVNPERRKLWADFADVLWRAEGGVSFAHSAYAGDAIKTPWPVIMIPTLRRDNLTDQNGISYYSGAFVKKTPITGFSLYDKNDNGHFTYQPIGIHASGNELPWRYDDLEDWNVPFSGVKKEINSRLSKQQDETEAKLTKDLLDLPLSALKEDLIGSPADPEETRQILKRLNTGRPFRWGRDFKPQLALYDPFYNGRTDINEYQNFSSLLICEKLKDTTNGRWLEVQHSKGLSLIEQQGFQVIDVDPKFIGNHKYVRFRFNASLKKFAPIGKSTCRFLNERIDPDYGGDLLNINEFTDLMYKVCVTKERLPEK